MRDAKPLKGQFPGTGSEIRDASGRGNLLAASFLG